MTTHLSVVIRLDIKGPMTPTGRLNNRYMINFVDYKINYCRVLLPRTKDAAAKKFEHFVVFSRKLVFVVCTFFAQMYGEIIKILMYL